MDSKGENEEKARDRHFVSNIIGTSPKILGVVKLIEKIANSPLNVLITGESGTGKELAARTIHTNSSRSDKPFIDINCAALPESLLESELFGIEKGVATGVERRVGKIEAANSGTLFLDEIGDMSLSAQAKLLRVLQERKLERVGGRGTINLDVRVLAATNKDLKGEIKKGSFREDLYYRLSAVHILMPSLRDMREDISLLAEHFLSNFVKELGKGSMRFSSEAMDCLLSYGWPGNVRELENEVKRAAILAHGNVIEESNLSEDIRSALENRILESSRGALQRAPTEQSPQFLRGTVEEIEIQRIKEALEKSGGNRQKAAKILGITRTGLIYKIKKYGLSGETKPGIKCQSCGKENPPDKELCYGCGHKLNEGVKPVKTPKLDEPQSYIPKHLADKILETRASLEGERKQVTVLFADIYGSNEISEEQDPEEVGTLMNRCFEIIIEEVHRYEGTINQFTGEGVMALFGAPVALENHPHKAVSSALSIQRSLSKYGDELKKERGIDLEVRIGISTGLVVVGRISSDLKMDYTAIGDIINLASRLKGLAEPGTILIGENTYGLVREYFSIKPLGEFKVEGKVVKAYRVFGSGRSTAPFDIASERGLTRFVGREKEINTLRDRLNRAIEGFGQVVAILGEAGLGKSRLIYEFRRSIEAEKITYLEATCLSYGKSTPYLPIIGILKSNFRVESADDESVIKGKLEEGIKKMGYSLEWTLPYFHRLLSLREKGLKELDEREIKRRTHEAIKAITLRESQIRPLVLVIENVHWIDSASEEFLNYLVGNIARSSTMIVVSSRPGYVPTFTDKSYYTQVTLSPLSDIDCDTILKELLEADSISAELRELFLSKCEGNPFYLEEVVKDFLEEGIIRRANGKYVLSKEASKLRVPGTIQNVIMSRIDRLNEDLKRTLQHASVIGRDFSYKLLKETMEIGEELQDYLTQLQGLELVYERSLFPDLEYRFKHSLTQEVSYNSLLIKWRKKLHGKVGEIIEDLYRDKLEENYELLAYHYGRSTSDEKAVDYLTLAGDKSAKIYSTEDTIGYYEEALKRLDTMPDSRTNKEKKVDIFIKLAGVMRLMGRFKEHIKTLEKNLLIVEGLGDKDRLSEYYFKMGFYYSVMGDLENAIKYCTKSIELAELTKNERIIGLASVRQGYNYLYKGEFENAISIVEKGIKILERMGDHYWLARSFQAIGSCYWHMGDWDKSISYMQKLLEKSEKISDVNLLALSYFSLSFSHVDKGEWDIGIEYGKRCLDISPTPLFAAYGLGYLGYGYCKKGELEKAIEYLEKATQQCKQFELKHQETISGIYLGEACLSIGERDKALEKIKRALEISKESGFRYWEGRAYRALGEIYGEAKSDVPRKYIEDSIKIFKEIGAKNELAKSYFSLGRLYKEKGERDKAKNYFTQALHIFEKLGTLHEPEKARKVIGDLG